MYMCVSRASDVLPDIPLSQASLEGCLTVHPGSNIPAPLLTPPPSQVASTRARDQLYWQLKLIAGVSCMLVRTVTPMLSPVISEFHFL